MIMGPSFIPEQVDKVWSDKHFRQCIKVSISVQEKEKKANAVSMSDLGRKKPANPLSLFYY